MSSCTSSRGRRSEAEGFAIGAVEGVQGISWTELTLLGQSNHAGTTPMRMRRDAGYVAAEIAAFARRLARDSAANQVATVGALTLSPNLVNVVAERAVMTVDLRNTDNARLKEAERRLAAFVAETAAAEGVTVESANARPLRSGRLRAAAGRPRRGDRARIRAPVKRLPSGAGHDAQMLAAVCPACMIFVPSAGGVSHNIAEYTAPEQCAAGADVLLRLVDRACGMRRCSALIRPASPATFLAASGRRTRGPSPARGRGMPRSGRVRVGRREPIVSRPQELP